MSEEPPSGSEDANGPPRLMITKIVCENFKSYAGTKALGPFHKVGCFLVKYPEGGRDHTVLSSSSLSFQCFTSIVGPNGSGKSNVIDAMLFVFGYRATKIRSKKVSVLIHKSDQHRDLKHCSVAVHFQQIRDLVSVQDGVTTLTVFSSFFNLRLPSLLPCSLPFSPLPPQPGPDDFEVVPGSVFTVSRTAYADNSSVYHLNGKKLQFKEIAALLRESGIDLDHNRFLILQVQLRTPCVCACVCVMHGLCTSLCIC